MNNLSDTCIMNRILQLLLHNDKFIYNILIVDKTSNKSITNAFFKFFDEILNLINLNGNNFSFNNVLSPILFKNEIIDKHKEFSIGQHDGVEFMRIIFKDLINENNLNLNIASYKVLDNYELDKIQLSKQYADFIKTREDSFINKIFYTQLTFESYQKRVLTEK